MCLNKTYMVIIKPTWVMSARKVGGRTWVRVVRLLLLKNME